MTSDAAGPVGGGLVGPDQKPTVETEMTTPTVPFPARRAMQTALWEKCIRPGDSEWTTWSDCIVLAECAADALLAAGWKVVSLDAETTDG